MSSLLKAKFLVPALLVVGVLALPATAGTNPSGTVERLVAMQSALGFTLDLHAGVPLTSGSADGFATLDLASDPFAL